MYVGIIGHMVRWFPDRRGFAAGIAAAGYGAGAIITSFPIADMIPHAGYAQTLIVWGWIQLVVGVVVSQAFRIPPAGWKPEAAQALAARQASRQSQTSYRAAEMLRTPVFWLMFIMMSMMATSGRRRTGAPAASSCRTSTPASSSRSPAIRRRRRAR